MIDEFTYSSSSVYEAVSNLTVGFGLRAARPGAEGVRGHVAVRKVAGSVTGGCTGDHRRTILTETRQQLIYSVSLST